MTASIDVGNSRIKVGIFDAKGVLQKSSSLKNEDKLISFLKSENIDSVIISDVGNANSLLSTLNREITKVLVLNRNIPLPIEIAYKSPETLGIDRLAAAVGALNYHSGPLLVIDAGSCITIDFIDSQNVFQGGIITPGLEMRLKAMHTFTASLPLLELSLPGTEIPDTTSEAMLTGAVIGSKHELIGFINHFKAKYPDLKVIICGGNANYFDKMIELDIFVLPNLVLEGLNAILRYND